MLTNTPTQAMKTLFVQSFTAHMEHAYMSFLMATSTFGLGKDTRALLISVTYTVFNLHTVIILNLSSTRMWANAQPDGRPAEHRWRPLFNAAKFA